MQYLSDGRKILIQHPCSVPIPYTKRDSTKSTEAGSQGGGFSYDETATQMLHLFETSGNNETELENYFITRNYIQNAADQSTSEQQLIQNYMLQAQLQQSQLFFSQPSTAAVVQANPGVAQTIIQPQTIVSQPQLPPAPQAPVPRKPRTYNRAPRNTTYIEEEPEPPKREVMCYSVQAGDRQKTTQKVSDPPSDDIEDMLDTFFIVNDKNSQTPNGGGGGGGGVILGN